MRPLRSEEDVSLAFQMALGQGAVSDALGVDLARQFQIELRPTGWQPDDFNPPDPPGKVHHWTISEGLQQSFTRWSPSDRGRLRLQRCDRAH